MPYRAGLAVAASVAFLAASLRSEDLELHKLGGAYASPTELSLAGDPLHHYAILFDVEETSIDLGGGLFLDVGFRYLPLSFAQPGFVGSLDASGRAKATFELPDDPILEGVVLSFQCVTLAPVDAVSNLVRITPAHEGTFDPTLAPPVLPLTQATMATGPDGKVQILDAGLPVLQRYDADREEFEATGLGCALGLFGSTVFLPDGRVFLSGGLSLTDGQPTASAWLLDPATGTCTQFAMATPRAGHAAALTKDGEVLIVGGFDAFDLTDLLTLFSHVRADSEIFDPATGTFRAGPAMLEPKAFHTATTTAAGGVLVSGGLTLVPILDIPFVSPTGYLYDAASEKFGIPLLFTEGRMLHSATLLDDDRILLAGGINIDFSDFLVSGDPADLRIGALDSGEVWKKGFLGGSFDHAPGMSEFRALPAIAPLPGGRALVCGGFDLSITGDITQWVFEPKAGADVYASLAFTATGPMAEARITPTAIRLDDGTVLVLGGGAAGAEIYQD